MKKPSSSRYKHRAAYFKEWREKMRTDDPERYKRYLKRAAVRAMKRRKEDPIYARLLAKRRYQKPKYKHYAYRIGAEKRGLEFSLTVEDFEVLTKLPCTYCGSTKEIGLDRAVSSLGYTRENCVSCCKVCNFHKGHMDKKDFIERCIIVAGYFKSQS